MNEIVEILEKYNYSNVKSGKGLVFEKQNRDKPNIYKLIGSILLLIIGIMIKFAGVRFVGTIAIVTSLPLIGVFAKRINDENIILARKIEISNNFIYITDSSDPRENKKVSIENLSSISLDHSINRGLNMVSIKTNLKDGNRMSILQLFSTDLTQLLSDSKKVADYISDYTKIAR